MSLEGKITLSLAPPGYGKSIDKYSEHPDLVLISELLGNNLTSQEDDESIAEENLLTDSEEENFREMEVSQFSVGGDESQTYLDCQ